jgi:hypothetical protein
MALTFGTPVYERLPQSAGVKKGYLDITFDSSYAAGGEAIAYTNIKGLDNSILGLWPIAYNIKTWAVQYDSTAGKLVANAVGAEASGDLSGLTVRMYFIGH